MESGPRRGKEGAIENHIAVKWHIIALQEASEHLEHDYLTSYFYVTHFAGCAVLLNKDTFHSDSTVTSVYLHDTRDRPQVVKERQSGWVLQAVICIIPKVTAQRQNILHHDVITLLECLSVSSRTTGVLEVEYYSTKVNWVKPTHGPDRCRSSLTF